MKIIIDYIKAHILPSILNLKTTYEMTIKNTLEINNTSRLLILKQLLYIKMNNEETIASYFVIIEKLMCVI